MKKCPFCKADMEDNARFCLYCMNPLNDKEVIPPHQKKKPWWLPILIGGLCLVFLVGIFFLMNEKYNLFFAPDGTEIIVGGQPSETQNDSTSQESTSEHPRDGDLPTEDTTAVNPPSHPNTPTPAQPQTPKTPTENTPPAESTTVPFLPPETTTPSAPDPTTAITTPSTEPEETTPSVTEPETPTTQSAYAYRAARAGDDFNANYTNSGNDIVITGVLQSSASGVYDIPAYIDGKKVIAIMGNAFSGTNARIVYVPSTVKNIWNYAFYNCNLTDIYFRGNSIYAESKAFSGGFTIHCSSSCSDRNFRYYKNCAASYGATWAEWNG